MQTSVFIVSELRVYGEGLADALGRYPQISLLGAATEMPSAVRAIRACRPDVVLIDIGVEGGVAAVRGIRAAAPNADLVAMAVPEAAADIMEYAEAGISGYVTRNGSLQDLVEAVEGAARGELICPDRLAATLFRRVEAVAAERSDPDADGPRLTPRELEVMELVEEGLSNREIAERLCIALPTVKNHLHSIFEKLHVHRRSEAAACVRSNPILAAFA
jgi:two-component system, NarL family, nitrate/nitrite response regulator NarL